MPTTLPEPGTETPRGPQGTPGFPDRKQDGPVSPPITDPGDTKNPNDPPIPAGVPASFIGAAE